ncbi:MAG: cellulase family glycosylhydrolase [Planctomycetes bacterium]|nr:cellulase family glycosylhydrolase [Planctomycetota bacterium]
MFIIRTLALVATLLLSSIPTLSPTILAEDGNEDQVLKLSSVAQPTFMWGLNMPNLGPFAPPYFLEGSQWHEPPKCNISLAPDDRVMSWGTEVALPTYEELEYWKSKGIKLVRLNIQWEWLQQSLFGELNPVYLGWVNEALDRLNSKGYKVLIDVRCVQFGDLPTGYFDCATDQWNEFGSNEVPISALADLWRKLAHEWRNRSEIWGYGLLNEPYHLPLHENLQTKTQEWFDCSQICIDSIRSEDINTTIVIPGYGLSTTEFWIDRGNDILKNLIDPSDNLVFEGHMYMEYAQESGSDCDTDLINFGPDRLAPFVNWLRENNLKGIIGEMGSPPSPDCWIERLRDTFEYVENNQDVLVGLCYWYSGRRSASEYGSNIWPWGGVTSDENLRSRPQGDVLEEFAKIEANPPYVDRDINQDGSENVLDMILIGQHWDETNSAGWIVEDVNKDGTIDVLDMILI